MMKRPFFSIVIPFYNRAWSVERAIASAVAFGTQGVDTEIILIDDGSKDDSRNVVKRVIDGYASNAQPIIRLVVHERNLGVCAAKNTGAKLATGMWVVFLDSDDELIQSAATEVHRSLQTYRRYPLHFFACVEEQGLLSRAADRIEQRAFNDFLLKGTGGEALPVVLNDVFREYLYDEDIRGYESLCYLRMVREHNYALLHSLVVRRYYTEHEDRLSSRAGMKRRWHDLAKGHLRVISQHCSVMTLPVLLKQCGRFLKAKMLAVVP
ncbi:glycosyltransferase family 2 protein [Massilia sp. UMI-21]|nr:glycosyltransferase family 2 protein [Massilia sp. UMI-21]